MANPQLKLVAPTGIRQLPYHAGGKNAHYGTREHHSGHEVERLVAATAREAGNRVEGLRGLPM